MFDIPVRSVSSRETSVKSMGFFITREGIDVFVVVYTNTENSFSRVVVENHIFGPFFILIVTFPMPALTIL